MRLARFSYFPKTTISAAAGLMGNDYILSLRTGDGLMQRDTPAAGARRPGAGAALAVSQ